MTLEAIKVDLPLSLILVTVQAPTTTAANLATTLSRTCLALNANTKYLTGQDQVITNTSELTI